MKWLRRLAKLAVLLLALVLLAIGGLVAALWLSLPSLEGRVVVAGLGASAAITRDDKGVVFIRAKDGADAAFALGFAHAQDRLWQMEAQRRFAAGRTAELLGPAALSYDRFMRVMGVYALAERDVEILPPETRRDLEAYAAGVNSFLDSHRGLLPIELTLLGASPEPWRPVDSIVWGRLMAMRLGGAWRTELLRARMASRLTPEQMRQLWPDYPADAPTTLAAAPGALLDRLAQSVPAPIAGQGASNAWVVDGRHTRSGKPILANDPHLGLSLPGVWYLARIETPDGVIAGATAPGVPFTVLGHNGHVAWGLTTTGSDTADVFVERLVANDLDRYETPDGPQAFTVREERIKVRFGNEVVQRVRSSRHGPIISDVAREASVAGNDGVVLALADTSLRPENRTAEALYRINHAKDAGEVRAVLPTWDAPQQNLLYADTSGAIGFAVAGLLPIRAKGDGSVPASGWAGDMDWTGFVPADRLPAQTDPPRGWIANANEKVAGPDYPFFMGRDWDWPYRAQRLRELIARPDEMMDIDRSVGMQLDTLSLDARDLLPYLLASHATSERARLALDQLAAWDGRMDADGPEPLIYEAWLREFSRLLFAERLGDLFPAWWAEHAPIVLRILRGDDPGWCGTAATDAPASCADRATQALESALATLDRRYGPDPRQWRWGVAHKARFRHVLFGLVPYLWPLFDLDAEIPGGNYTLLRASPRIADEADPFGAVHGAEYRAVYDLADLDASRVMIAPGQSGNPLSPHYGDLVEPWRTGSYRRLVPPAAGKTLELVPR